MKAGILLPILLCALMITLLPLAHEVQNSINKPKYMEFKTVTRIENCADSGLCRVYFDDDSTDLLYYPYIGMKMIKDEK